MKLIVCGGREDADGNEYNDYHAMRKAIELLKPTHIAHGAAKGADRVADEVAMHMRIPVRRFPADWKQLGRSAGMIRNGQMLKHFAPDAVLAAPGGNGTGNMILRSLRQELPVYAIAANRDLVRLPGLERNRYGKHVIPHDREPREIVAELLQRATPFSALTAQNTKPEPKPEPDRGQNVIGGPPYIETGPHAQSLFSPYRAQLKSHGGLTVHQIYTAAKVFADGSTCLTPQQAEGREPVNKERCAELYAAAWQQYLIENPDLMETLLRAQGIANVNAPKEDVCPARELWKIRQTELKRRCALGLPVPEHPLSAKPRFNTPTRDSHEPEMD